MAIYFYKFVTINGCKYSFNGCKSTHFKVVLEDWTLVGGFETIIGLLPPVNAGRAWAHPHATQLQSLRQGVLRTRSGRSGLVRYGVRMTSPCARWPQLSLLLFTGGFPL